MRKSTDKWSFYNIPARGKLSADEVAYWKKTMSSILKVGMELEFNLPEKKNGTCKGDSNTCPCTKLNLENDCWQKCVNEGACDVLVKNIDDCTNVTGTCTAEDCEKCEHFSGKCNSIFCSNFVSKCYICTDFQLNCTECKFKYDPNKNPDFIRQALNEKLRPNNSYGQVSDSGVHSITTDGSLLGKKGAEVITTGRRIDYWEFFKMASNIINESVGRGAYMNERCSIHMHVLASYYGKITDNQERHGIPSKVSEMERELPEIVLANLHQLVRRYQNAMTWMMMGLDEPERMTRWEKFRVSVLPISAATNHMRDVQNKVAHQAGGNKYGWINYNPVEFGPNGNVKRFHVEFRGADGLMAPSAVAAIACMYYALVIKAIEISRYGILEIGDDGWLEKATEVKNALLNNMKGYQDGDRFSDTRNLNKYRAILIEDSFDLARQLKAILVKVGPAYEVLEKLAERPIALRRVDGESWETIEKDLAVIVNEEGRFDLALSEIIILNQVSECKDLDEWINEVGVVLRSNKELAIDEDNAEVEDHIRYFIDKNRNDGKVIWSNKTGAPMMV